MKNGKKVIAAAFASIALSLVAVLPAAAHVVVRPGEVMTGSYVTFNVSVPNERDTATTEIRLEVPEGLGSVMPTVKQGWTIATEQAGTAENDAHAGGTVTSISWTGGQIPVGQRDDFTFSAKTPDSAGELRWNAYQTYADGTVVAWDKSAEEQPKKADGSPDFSTSGPFSVTVIAAEAEDAETTATGSISDADRSADRALYVAIAAVVVAFIALILATRPKK